MANHWQYDKLLITHFNQRILKIYIYWEYEILHVFRQCPGDTDSRCSYRSGLTWCSICTGWRGWGAGRGCCPACSRSRCSPSAAQSTTRRTQSPHFCTIHNINWEHIFSSLKIFDLPLSPDPVVARLARGSVVVVLGHGGPHALHLVPVLDVGEGEHLLEAGEGLALLPPEAEVPAPGDALTEVHDLHVGPREHAPVARRQPPVSAACVFGQALMEIFLSKCTVKHNKCGWINLDFKKIEFPSIPVRHGSCWCWMEELEPPEQRRGGDQQWWSWFYAEGG